LPDQSARSRAGKTTLPSELTVAAAPPEETTTMKTSSLLVRAADLVSVGALLAFVGCTNVPLRQSTLALEAEHALSIEEMGPGYEPPVAIHVVKPELPWEMRKFGITGEVEVSLVIDTTGKVVDAEVANSTSPAFEDSTLAALKQWTFKPAARDGTAYTSRVILPVRYRLTD
jgi:TonB family protein